MKDETKGVPVAEFVGLRSKMYSFINDGGIVEKKKAKWINVVKKIKHVEYRDVLSGKKCVRYEIKRIQSKNQTKNIQDSQDFFVMFS